MTRIPSDDILESLYTLRIRGSDGLVMACHTECPCTKVTLCITPPLADVILQSIS